MGHDGNSKKEEGYSTTPTSTGVTTDLRRVASHGVATMAVKQSTKEKTILLIRQALLTNKLSSTEAGTLRGKTRFVLSFTQGGRGALAPITRRQYYSEPHDILTADLKDALNYLLSLMTYAPLTLEVRMIPSTRPPTLIWSDGSFQPSLAPMLGYGEIGFVVLYRTSWDAAPMIFFASLVINNDWLHEAWEMRRQSTFIMPIETAGIAAPYFCTDLQWILFREDVIHFGDNQAANGASIKGYSSAPDVNHIATNTHIRTQQLKIRLWIEDVRSKSNIGDDPSRSARERLYAIPTKLQEMFADQRGGESPPARAVQEMQLDMPPIRAWDRSMQIM